MTMAEHDPCIAANRRRRHRRIAYDLWGCVSCIFVLAPILGSAIGHLIPHPFDIIMVLSGMVWVAVEKWRSL